MAGRLVKMVALPLVMSLLYEPASQAVQWTKSFTDFKLLMFMKHDNERAFKEGLSKALKMFEDALFESLWNSAVALLKHVGRIHKDQGWQGFTGNTQLSYMCGIYMNGQLEGVVTQDNWHEPPVRNKIRGATYLTAPYEGDARGIPTKNWSVIDTDGDYGYNSSLQFLQEYRAPKNKITLVMTTGTEYSEYIEEVQHLDVLSGTFERASRIMSRCWKKVGDSRS